VRDRYLGSVEPRLSALATVVSAAHQCVRCLVEPDLRHIMLLDAQPALGWHRVRELDGGMLSTSEIGATRARWRSCCSTCCAKPRWRSPAPTISPPRSARSLAGSAEC
jgi:hypothetical protein